MLGPMVGIKHIAKLGAAIIAFVAFGIFSNTVWAQDDIDTTVVQEPDLIEMPTARMEPDGTLSAGFQYLRNNERYDLGFQALPWLQAHFQYAGLAHYDPSYPVYWDRSFGFKARLWNEGDVLPSVAIGIDDLIGTGIFSGEYLVASKQFGNVDASFGMGWGIYGSTDLFRNPLTLFSSSFNQRPIGGVPGATDFDVLFHGHDVGLFGGATWHTPIDGLSLTAEYSSNTYQRERLAGNLVPKSQGNYGITYDLGEATSISLDWLYGTTLGGSVFFATDPIHSQFPQKIGPPPPPFNVRDDEERQRAIAGLRDNRTAGQILSAKMRATDRNKFIDALWRQSDDYTDVQVRRQTLELTVTGPISNARCMGVATLLQGVHAEINDIQFHSSRTDRTVSCPVAHTVESLPISAALLSQEGFDTASINPIAIQTIDASDVTANANRDSVEDKIRKAITAQSIFVEALSLRQSELILYYNNGHYFAETDAIDRIVRVLSKEAPPEIEKFRLIAVHGGVPVQEFDILRSPIERNYQQEDGTIFDHSIEIVAPSLSQPALSDAAEENYPRFDWDLFPQFRQALFDPNQPLGIQFVAVASVLLELAPGLSLSTALEGNLFDNFNTARTSDSLLPHVRSDFNKYFTDGKNGIAALRADYTFRLAPDVFAAARAGYLESMFAGAGGEVLWQPEGTRWALGADAYDVWQRKFDRLFGLQGYHQITGHVSLYYDSPWYGLNFEFRAGQYLAGDRGFTLQITRRFSTGVEIGAFFTKTNVSASQFGEGSFDKGLIIRLPLDWIAPLETQNQIAMDIRPVQRDGGQALSGDATLYDWTRSTSEGEILRQQSDAVASR